MDVQAKQQILNALACKPAIRKKLESILHRLQPCVWLVPAKRVSSTSRIGGWPLMPPGSIWPMRGDDPLPYLMGIDLSALPLWTGLPRTGTLHLFGAFAGVIACHVLPGMTVSELRPHDPMWADGFPINGEPYDACPLQLIPGLRIGPLVGDGGEDAVEDLDALSDALSPVDAIGRIGGGGLREAGDEASCQEHCYLRAHCRERIFFRTHESLADIDDQLTAALKQAPREFYDPVQLPTALVERIERQAEDFIHRAQQVIDLLTGKKFPDLANLLKQARRIHARFLTPRDPLSGMRERGFTELVFALNALLQTVATATGEKQKAVKKVFSDEDLAPSRAFEAVGKSALAKLSGNPETFLAEVRAIRAQSAARSQAQFSSALPDDPQLAFKLLHERFLEASMRRDNEALRSTWTTHLEALRIHAEKIPLHTLSYALREHGRIANNLNAAQYHELGPPPDELRALRDDLAWWHADATGHRAAIARWRPLLTLSSEGEFSWGDCGTLLVYADMERVALGDLTQLQGTVESG